MSEVTKAKAKAEAARRPARKKTRKRRSSRAVQHENYSAEHYTPTAYVEAARLVLGVIELDPASCAVANATVQATRYYTAAENGLLLPWGGLVYVNSPNDRTGRPIQEFWHRINEHALFGGPGAAGVWAGFNVSQLGSLQGVECLHDGRPCPAPQDWPMVTVGPGAPHTSKSGRICWVSGETGEPGTQPGSQNFFCLLGGDKAMRARFREFFGAFGKHQAPTRPITCPAWDRTLDILSLLHLRGPMSKSALAREIGGRKSAALVAVNALIRAGRVQVHGRGKASVCAVPDHREPKGLALTSAA